MVRISLVTLCVIAATLITSPFANAYILGQGERNYYSGGALCLPQGYAPTQCSTCEPALPEPCGPPPVVCPMPMPSRICKCRHQAMPACRPSCAPTCMPACMPSCMPAPCPPPTCGPMMPPCSFPCSRPMAWY
jgi:hypothetical protein